MSSALTQDGAVSRLRLRLQEEEHNGLAFAFRFRLIALGIDWIETDDPERLLALL